MKVVNRKGLAHGPFRAGLQMLPENAAETVALRKKVEQIAVRRPARIGIQPCSTGDCHPVILMRDCSHAKRSDQDSSLEQPVYAMKCDPVAVGRESCRTKAAM